MKTFLRTKDSSRTGTRFGRRRDWRLPAKRVLVFVLAVLLPLFQAGCVVLPPTPLFENPSDRSYLRETTRSPWGALAVVPARFVPETDFPDFPSGSGLSPGGAAAGAAGGAALWGLVIVASGCLNPFAGATCPAVLPFAAGGAAVGAVAAGSGEKPGEAAMTGEQAQAAINAALQTLDLQRHAADQVLAYAGSMTPYPLVIVPDIGPASRDQQPDYAALRSKGIDTVLEVSVLHLGMPKFSKPSMSKPPDYQFLLTARARLIRASDNSVLHDRQYGFVGKPRTVSAWAENNAEAFRQQLHAGLQDLGEQMLDRALLIYDPPGYPKFNWVSLREDPPLSLVQPEPHWSGFYTVDSLQPTLRWQAFPTPDMLEADKGGELQGVADVGYELRIYDELRYWGGFFYYDLIYSRTVKAPEHSLEQPLKACGNYRVTFRARFTLAGVPRVTQWAGNQPFPIAKELGRLMWFRSGYSLKACPKAKN